MRFIIKIGDSKNPTRQQEVVNAANQDEAIRYAHGYRHPGKLSYYVEGGDEKVWAIILPGNHVIEVCAEK